MMASEFTIVSSIRTSSYDENDRNEAIDHLVFFDRPQALDPGGCKEELENEKNTIKYKGNGKLRLLSAISFLKIDRILLQIPFSLFN